MNKYKIILTILWIISLTLLILGIFLNKNLYLLIPGGILAVLFTIIYSKKMFSELNFKKKIFKKQKNLIKLILFSILFLALVIILGIMGQLFLVTGIILVIASLILIFKNHKLLKKKYLLISIILTIIVMLTTQNNELSWRIINGVFTFFPFLGGIILIKKSNLNQKIIFSDWKTTIKNFGLGCLLALPIAVLNALALMEDKWITEWYHPLFAIKPAIFEEILIRLFLMVAIIILLNRYSNLNTKKTYIFSIIGSGLVFTMLHGLNPLYNLYGLIVFSVPLSILFLRKGLSCSIGNHFTIDFIRYLAYFLLIVHPF